MKNLFKKLHIMSNQQEDVQGSTSSRSSNKPSDVSASPDRSLHSRSHQYNPEHKPFSGLSNWLNSIANRKSPSPPSSSNIRGERLEPSDSINISGLDAALEAVRRDSGSSHSRDPDIEEEYQIQLALELSAREDPEAVQIEAVKQISLGSCAPENTPAEVVAYRYWNYNSLSYDDKILDGFYDLYGVLTESISERMPSLVDLQGIPISENVTWEAVLVNRVGDANLLKLEQKALEMVVKSRSGSPNSMGSELARKLAVLVAEYMGGPVADPDSMSRAWRSLSYSLKATLGSMVLPLGSLTIGLARHRALLYKVLADSVGIPCRLVKGQQYTGSDEVAMNFVKTDDGREYIVDLMADPGTLIPSDAAGSHIEYDDSLFSASPLSRDIDSSHIASSSSGVESSLEEHSEFGTSEKRSRFSILSAAKNQPDKGGEFNPNANIARKAIHEEEAKTSSDGTKSSSNADKLLMQDLPNRPNYPYSHARSPSWTEGVSSPAVRRMKVKDVSQYMIDAAKENPQLAQKLHDVLLESGVVAPPNLFTEIYPEQLDAMVEVRSLADVKDESRHGIGSQETRNKDDLGPARFLPPLPQPKLHLKASPVPNPAEQIKPVEGLGGSHLFDTREATAHPVSPQSEASPAKYAKNVPVAAAAAAAAAVVASSMVVAAAKSSTDSNIELPVAAAATATAAAVVATTAAVSKQYEQGARSDRDTESSGYDPRGSEGHDSLGANAEGERISDKSAGNDSTKSDVALDDVAECEIPWDEIALGERIGLGSYGEVYRGDWRGTEVAVKKFLDQDITGESLLEFKSEVCIMKRLRHPNVVLFMGAVTRPPNLSIVTEFLPRGSLYRLLHRPNNQLDERRRLRMALDAARGMNYLHSCSPVIVHRDLKSPNLLVDKNWVVKAEWMAPEVLRNEPSDEKCDVYSFGVILWELSTMQQPWGGMNPMQVVGAVGFQHRRLDIPDNMDPTIANIIRRCWQTDPKLRPTFAEIMAALKPLQKPITSSQVLRPGMSVSNAREKGQPSRLAEEETG
ncbi:probable serine/threonine-protein kinase SIS8 isoform X2 [Carica papaya]|uniref:probable serine/threonine-protein kinase SIS8 isoform X2 n=1 Tax=Carica papaya TaxID=3649 RepID=UPI000B8CD446|nr:probable serine/threonine-protein kinase SIS8 isoform X2 [Carica papaya]